MYHPSSENKGADQLCGYREADLHLCFRICIKPVFSRADLHLCFRICKKPVFSRRSSNISLKNVFIFSAFSMQI